MAQFSYSEYEKQKAARDAAKSTASGKDFTKSSFLGAYLKEDGDTVVVRFPYHSMEDITFNSVHKVEDYPGRPFGAFVQCAGDGCSLCKSGNKKLTRFYAKAIAYVANEKGDVELIPCIWDRPAAFADIDIKNLITEYGDLTEQLFKIKRNGKGTDTRYTITVIVNKTVYNPEVYKKDLSLLETIDPARVLTKTIEQYEAAKNGTGPVESATVEAAPVTPVITPATPVTPVTTGVTPAPVTTPTPVTPGRSKYVF